MDERATLAPVRDVRIDPPMAPGVLAPAAGSGGWVARVLDAAVAPGTGAVILPDGRVLRSTLHAPQGADSLDAIPFVRQVGAGRCLCPPPDIPHLDRVAPFVSRRARHSFAPFLLEALPALTVLSEAGLLETHEPVAPELTHWQAALVAAVLTQSHRPLRQTPAPLLIANDLAMVAHQTTPALGASPLLRGLRERLLSATPRATTRAPRIYLSRHHDTRRRMVNEAELEAELRVRGFKIVTPELLSIERQIGLLHTARVVVAATGPSLAATLFCTPAASILEIRPEPAADPWVQRLCETVELNWSPFDGERDAADPSDILQSADWRAPVAAVLKRVDDLG